MNKEKPVLFWDFHGTLTLPDITWFDVAAEVAAEKVPEKPLDAEVLKKNLGASCLPWFTIPSRDTRHVAGSEKWWAHSAGNFAAMYVQCGFTQAEAAAMAPLLRGKVLQPQRYRLYPDALPTLRTLAGRGIQSYILSNNFPELAQLTHALGLGELLQGVLVSGEIGFDKPRLEIFEYARQVAGWPKEPWMIGDNPSDDIDGGRAAGFVSVAVHGVHAPQAAYSVNDLAEILQLLPEESPVGAME